MTVRKRYCFLVLWLMAGSFFLMATNNEPINRSEVLQVENVLKRSCTICHSGKTPSKSLSLEPGIWQKSILNVPSIQKPEYKIIDIQNPEKSYLLMKIMNDPGIDGEAMPLKSSPLTDEETGLIRQWVVKLSSDLSTGAPPTSFPVYGGKRKTPVSVFPSIRQVNLETTALLKKNEFLFLVSHRFQPSVKTGYETFYGIDGPASVYLHLGYGISDRLNVYVGRSNTFQAVFMELKWLAFNNGHSVSKSLAATLSVGATINTQKSTIEEFEEKRIKYYLSAGLSYQIINRLVLFCAPMFATNVNHWEEDSSNTLALGLGLRFTAIKKLALLAEWIPVLSGHKDQYSGWALGLEYPIGKHVFQTFIMNTIGVTPDQFIYGGDLNVADGDLRFGFSIHRTF